MTNSLPASTLLSTVIQPPCACRLLDDRQAQAGSA
jgi:hypothetical protein